MVATDSYRLSVKETALEQALEGELEANVPARTLQELARIAGERGRDGEIAGRRAREPGRLHGRRRRAVVAPGRGSIPELSGSCCPRPSSTSCASTASELLDVVRRISLLAQKNAPLRMEFTEGALEVSAQTPDVGEASESLPVPFKGEPLEIGFNPEFLRDGLESAESEELVLKLISPLRPGLIQSGDDGRLHLPRHADPSERLERSRRCVVTTRHAARLPQLRARGGSSWARASPSSTAPTAPARRICSRRSTSAAPAARAAPRTSASWSASGQPVARVEVEVRPTDGQHRSRSASRRARRSTCASTARRSTRLAARRRGRWSSVFLPDRLELVKGAPALRRAHLDQLVTALWPARADDALRLLPRARAAQRAGRRIRAGAARPEPARQWDAELARARRRADGRPRARRSSSVAPRFAERARRPRPARSRASSRYRPRSQGRATPRASARELAERRDADLERGFTAHGPHRDDLALLARRAGRCARYGSQGQQRAGAAGAAVRRARRAARARAAAAADAARRRDVGARRRPPRAAGRAARAPAARPSITTTEAEHVDRSFPASDLTATRCSAAPCGRRPRAEARRSAAPVLGLDRPWDAGAGHDLSRGCRRVGGGRGRGEWRPRQSPSRSARGRSRSAAVRRSGQVS